MAPASGRRVLLWLLLFGVVSAGPGCVAAHAQPSPSDPEVIDDDDSADDDAADDDDCAEGAGPGPRPAAPEPIPWTEVEVPPELISDYRVPYPEGASRDRIEGTVILKLTIDETGKVVRARAIRGVNAELDNAAIFAAGRFRFTPATVQGEPVAVSGYVYRYTFVLTGSDAPRRKHPSRWSTPPKLPPLGGGRKRRMP